MIPGEIVYFSPIERAYQSHRNRFVFTGPCPLDGQNAATDIRGKVGALVDVDGLRYRIVGVSTFAHSDAPKQGERIAISVEAGEVVLPPVDDPEDVHFANVFREPSDG